MKISIKYFCLFTFLIMEFMAMAAFAYCPEPDFSSGNTELNKKPYLTVCIILARRSDCEGFGICRITVNWKTVPGNGVTGNIYMNEQNSNLIIEIEKTKGATTENYSKYFSSGYFLMEDDSPLTTDIISGLGLTGSKTLVAGRYKVTEKDGRIFVNIPVK